MLDKLPRAHAFVMGRLASAWPMAVIACLCVLSCTPQPARLDEPTQAVVTGDGRVFVSDGYTNAQISVFDIEGRFLYRWGTKGYGRGQFNTPHGLALGTDGTVLVADRGNARVQRFTYDGEYVDQWHGQAIGRPWSVAVDPRDGSVYVVDGGDQDESSPRSGLIKLSAEGQVLCRWSSYGSGPGQLDWGHMLAISEQGELFVVDLRNRRVLKYVAATEAHCLDWDPTWQPQVATEDFDPLGIATAGGLVYVADGKEDAPIRVFDGTTGQLTDTLGEGLFVRAHGLSVDSDSIWVTDRGSNSVVCLGLDGQVRLQIGGQ